jgi:hypothetical protein
VSAAEEQFRVDAAVAYVSIRSHTSACATYVLKSHRSRSYGLIGMLHECCYAVRLVEID